MGSEQTRNRMDGGGDLILIGCLVRWLVTWLALFVPELRKSGKM